MKLIKTLLLLSQGVMSAALMGLLLNDPLILPELNNFDDFDERNKNYNIIVFDDASPELNKPGVLIKKIANTNPVRSILYTNSLDRNYISSFVLSGVDGIVSQGSGAEALREGIIKVAAGKRYFCNKIEKLLFENNETSNLSAPGILTLREKEILLLIKEGMTNKDIAVRLSISVKTVGRHKENIKSKLGLQHTCKLYKV